MIPSHFALTFRSTRNELGNCNPILVTVHLYRFLQLKVFVFYPCTLTSTRQGDAGIQDITPSLVNLTFRSISNQRGNCNPIYHVFLAPPLLLGFRNGTSQLCIFFWCPASHGLISPSIRLCIRHELALSASSLAAAAGGGIPAETSGKAVSLSASSVVGVAGRGSSRRCLFLAGIASASACSHSGNAAAILSGSGAKVI
jgi:hypothetical protein